VRHALLFLLLFTPLALADDASPDETVKKTLDERRVSVRLDATPVDDALDFLRDLTSLNIAIVASATDGKKITLRATDVSARSVFDAIAASDDDFSYEVWRGFVFVSSKKQKSRVPPAADWGEKARKVVTEKRLTANFVDVSLPEVLDFLNDLTGLSFSTAQDVTDLKVNLRCRDVPVSDALDVVCRLLGLKIVKAGDVSVLKKN